MLSGWGKFAVGALIAAAGIALVVVAAPVVLAAVAGAAVTAATAAAAVGVVAGGALIGAGIGLALAPDGCFQCQLNAMLKGALAGASAALAVMTLPFLGPMGPAFALAGGGTMAAAITAETLANATIGSAIVSTIVTMATTGTGGEGGGTQGSDDKKGSVSKEQLQKARDAQKRASEAQGNLPPNQSQKVVASNGTKTMSGYRPKEEMPDGFTRNEDLGAKSMLEHADENLSEHGYEPTESGPLDRAQPGANAATHAEKQLGRYQEINGENEPIGVSEEQCGDCRQWFRAQAQSSGQQQIVADPQYTRAYNPDGTVEIYDSNNNFVRTVPADEAPTANMRNYKGNSIPW